MFFAALFSRGTVFFPDFGMGRMVFSVSSGGEPEDPPGVGSLGSGSYS